MIKSVSQLKGDITYWEGEIQKSEEKLAQRKRELADAEDEEKKVKSKKG